MLDKRKKSRWGEGLGCMRAGVGYCGSVGERVEWLGGAGSGMAGEGVGGRRARAGHRGAGAVA